MKWEYLVVNGRQGFTLNRVLRRMQAELTKLGDEGWELVGVDQYFLFLKRPRTQTGPGYGFPEELEDSTDTQL